MRNPSIKRVYHGQNGGDKKQKNNYYMKRELIKIMFKKNGNNEKISQAKQSKNNTQILKNQTRNHINSKNKDIENKYIKSNNLNSLEGLQTKENNSLGINKIGKNNLTHKSNKPNMLLYNQYNTQNENKIKNDGNSNRPITQPSENKEVVGYKSCGKNNIKSVNNYRYNLNKNFISILNNNISDNFSNNMINIRDPKSLSKSPKRNHSTNAHHKNPEFVKQLEIMHKNQYIQYNKLNEFYQKENEINKKYSLFNFPELKNYSLNNNAQLPTEYFNNFLDTYCKEEKTLEFNIIPNFMDNQIDINNRMRAIVVNWMIEVHDRFKLLPDTLFLSVIIFDRYMSIIKNIKKERLQLIGVTSLLIACKYEEIFSPEVRDFVCILDRTYEKEDLMEQENLMLKVLKFEVTFPTSLRYFEILRVEFGIDEKYYNYGYYLLELCLIDCRFSRYMQAVIATTVCFFLLKIYYKMSFKQFMGKYIKIKENEIKDCLIDICFLIDNIDNSIYPAVNKKYKKISYEIKKAVFNNDGDGDKYNNANFSTN